MSINPGSEDPRRDDLLATIKSGMKVVDVDGDKVGTVSYVQMADNNEPAGEPETTGGDVELFNTSVSDTGGVGGILDVFDGDSDVTERMARNGYVKIDAAGLFAGDKYVEPHQVAAVEGDTVRLAIDKDDIEKPA